MTSERVEVVLRAFAAWNRGDPAAAVDMYAEDAELDLRQMELLDEGVRRGRDEVRRYFEYVFSYWRELEFVLREAEERDGWVLLSGALRGRSEPSGIELENEFSNALLVEGGQIVRDVPFRTVDGAARWVAARAAPLLLAVPNVSEGRDLRVLEAIERAFAPASFLDLHSDPDHHRAVFTLAGRQGELARALVSGVRAAVERIDVSAHTGLHPHVGALDVLPVVHLDDERRGAACAEALTAAALVGDELEVPVFLYGQLATRPEHAERAWIRRGGPRELARRLESGELVPDHGPPRAHPTAGAVLATARPPLVAFNVDLAGDDLELARRIAAELRESGGGLPGVRAIGLRLAERGRTQVSTNVHDHRAVPLREIVEFVRARAEVAEAELVGLAPRAAFEGFPEDVPLRAFDPERHLIEEVLAPLAG